MKTQTVKHTPGPWKIDDAIDLPLAVIEDSEHGYGICEIELSDESQANARLIAAAPDLLEACKRVLQAIEWAKITDRMSYEEKAATLRAAIAKAEGNQ